MIKALISFIQQHDVSDVIPLLFLWGVAVVGVIIALIWSVGVSTVIEKGPEDVTVSWSLAGLIRRRVASFPLKDLTNMVARERFYGIKGRKTRRYEILYGPEREKSEFLGRLTRRHIELLTSGVFLGMLKVDS